MTFHHSKTDVKDMNMVSNKDAGLSQAKLHFVIPRLITSNL